MKRAAICWACVTIGLLGPAQAADWARVPAAGADAHYFDRSKLVIAGDSVTYWRKVVFANPVAVRSGMATQAIYQEQIDCRQHTIRSLAWQLFAAEGAMLDTATTADAEAQAIVPETIGDRFQSAMCELVEVRRRRVDQFAQDRELLARKKRQLQEIRGEIERLELSIDRMKALDPTLDEPSAPPERPEAGPPR